jgi:hypothetical protein
MPRLPPNLIIHKLNVEQMDRLVKQPVQKYRPIVAGKIKEKNRDIVEGQIYRGS